MTELMLLLPMVIVALPLLILWSWRGGSLGWKNVPSFPHIIDRALTPIFITLTLLFGLNFPLDIYELGLLLGGAVAFLWGEIPGWGRQMDLGKNDKPDDEWGSKIRDLFFKSKSSFARDLVGLYMRMAWFIIPAVIWGLLHPIIALLPLSLVFLGPLIWVSEHKLFWAKGKLPKGPFGESWVEDVFGIMIFIFTVFITSFLIIT
jgi:hypothetical protein